MIWNDFKSNPGGCARLFVLPIGLAAAVVFTASACDGPTKAATTASPSAHHGHGKKAPAGDEAVDATFTISGHIMDDIMVGYGTSARAKTITVHGLDGTKTFHFPASAAEAQPFVYDIYAITSTDQWPDGQLTCTTTAHGATATDVVQTDQGACDAHLQEDHGVWHQRDMH